MWNAIVDQIDLPGSKSRWASVDDLERSRYFGRHPWILAAGGLELVEALGDTRSQNIKEVASSVGITSFTLEDDLYLMAGPTAVRLGIKVTGSDLWWRAMDCATGGRSLEK